jgi:hypothetical protein
MNKFKSILMAGVLFAGVVNNLAVCGGVTTQGQVGAGACIGLTIGSAGSRIWKKADEAGFIDKGGWLVPLAGLFGWWHLRDARHSIAEGSGIGDIGLNTSTVCSLGKFVWDLGDYYWYEKPMKKAIETAEEGELYRFRNGEFIKTQR